MKPEHRVSPLGPLRMLGVRSLARAKPRAGTRRRSTAACAGRCAPRPLRCSVLRPRRETRFVRFAHYAQTVSASLTGTRRAARAGRKPCAARRRRFTPPGTRPRLCNPPTSLCKGSRRPGIEPVRRHDARLRRAARAGSTPAARRKPLPKLDAIAPHRRRHACRHAAVARCSAVVVPAGAGPIRGRLTGEEATPVLKRQCAHRAVRARERGPENAGTATALPQPEHRTTAQRTYAGDEGHQRAAS